MREGLTFRRQRAPAKTPWSMIAVLLVVSAALIVRALWPTPGEPSALVEVRGDVAHPGIYPLQTPTIQAAVRAAGGGEGFLSTPVPPGYQVVVRGSTATIEPPSDPLLVALPVDLNLATEAQLDALPGIGPSTATAIINDRTKHGPFRSVRDLRRVRRVRQSTLDGLVSYVKVSDVEPLQLNRAPAGELETLPGIGPVLAARIVVYREDVGPFLRLEDLTRVRGIRPAVIKKISASGIPISLELP